MSALTHPVRRRITAAVQYAFCVVVSLVVLIPLYVAVTGGLKSMGDLMTAPLALPNPPQWNQYLDLLTGKLGTFWRALANSALIAAGTVAGALAVCVMAAFALARLRFRGRRFLQSYFMLGLLFPLAVAILPLYLQIRTLGLIDTYWGVILPQMAFQIPLVVLLLRGFFLSIPRDLEDACSIDGHGALGFLWNMVVPLSTPILATAGVLTLVASWNNFFLPLLVFNKETMFTLPMGVMNFQGQHSSDWNMILAFLTLAMVPAVALFIAAQRYIVAGLTGGAVKG
jgi:raffinose/stachyose/melibiose transport system permease protein